MTEQRVCTCIRLDCYHEKGKCEEPPVVMGGTCTTCRWYSKPKCPTCGQPLPEAPREDRA